MRLPLIWRPAPNANIAPARVDQPVEQVDLAATFARLPMCRFDWVQGKTLPTSEDVHVSALCVNGTASFPAMVFTCDPFIAMASC